MKRTLNQSELIKDKIEYYLEKGLKDVSEIVTNIVNDMKVPRPTVRRCVGELRSEYQQEVDRIEKTLKDLKYKKKKKVIKKK